MMTDIHASTARRIRREPAFTPIELLVVISIITMLISVLLPSLTKCRTKAKQSVCLAHLKNISTTGLVYASGDPHEFDLARRRQSLERRLWTRRAGEVGQLIGRRRSRCWLQLSDISCQLSAFSYQPSYGSLDPR